MNNVGLRFPRWHEWFRAHPGIALMLPVLVGLAGVIVTTLFWRMTLQQTSEAEELRFNRLADTVQRTIAFRLSNNQQILSGLKGLFAASKSVERGEFRAYVAALDLPAQRGAPGFGFIRYVRREDLTSFLERTRSDEARDFTLRQPGTAPDLFVVEYIEPYLLYKSTRGYNIGDDSIRRDAAVQAVELNTTILTRRSPLVHGANQNISLLLLMPIYGNGSATTTAAERWRALTGWVYCPIRMNELIQDILPEHSHQLDLALFEDDSMRRSALLYDSDGHLGASTAEMVSPAEFAGSHFYKRSGLPFGGRDLQLHINSRPEFAELGNHREPDLVLAVGLTLTTLVVFMINSIQRARHHATKLAQEMTVELREEIEQRKSLDEALRSVSRLQEAILRSASYAVISTTPDGVIRLFNPAAQHMLGYCEGEIKGRQTLSLFHDAAELAARAKVLTAELGESVAPGFETLVARSRRDRPDACEWTYIRKDGSRVPVLVSMSALRDQAGAFTGFLAIAQDVSERKQVLEQLVTSRQIAEHALREVELQRAALDQHAIVSITGRDGRIQYVNDKLCSISGYSKQELIGQDHRLLNSRHHPREFWRQFWRTISEGRVWHGEICNRSKQGECYWVDATVVPFRDPNGQITRYVGIRTDITVIKQQAEALEQARQAAEAASASKGDFLAVMSHEIRTPLNAVLGFADLLNETLLDRHQRDFLATIQTSGRALLDLIHDILDYSKVEAGKLEVDRVDFDAQEVVQVVVQTLSLEADRKHLSLQVEWPPSLDGRAQGDPGRVRQVLLNLIGNALKFTARGGVTVKLEAAAMSVGDGLRFQVTDTGPGIPPDQQGKLFQEFVQVDAAYTREAGGTGLGLAISKRLVELMGGQIGFTSREGVGTTFWFTLPRSTIASLPPREPVPSPSLAGKPAAGPPLRVLVVDDNPINVQLAVAFLDKLGCRALVAEDGFTAVSWVKAEKFDLVLMDCQMPGMDGFQTTMKIREWETAKARPERVPIIAVTANALEARSRSFESGMNAFISKPYQLADLKAAIATVISGRFPPSEPVAVSVPGAAPGAAPGTAMDHARALMLADNNPGLLGMLAGAFLAQYKSVLGEIHQAIKERDSAGLREHAHKLKGSVAMFAPREVHASALALEKHATPADWPALERLGQQLDDELNRLLPEISALELEPADVPA
jgi:PAS domain S-box-containing protein